MKRLVLIDGNAVLHRAFHALPPLTTSKGTPVNAVFGFTSMVLKVFKDLVPDYVACTFDLKAPTFRHKEFKAYKATRPKMADELVGQIPLIHQVVKTMNIPIFEKEGYEADDVIGTLARQAKTICHSDPAGRRGKNPVGNSEKVRDPSSRCNTGTQDENLLEVIIVTGDRDTLQLVDENTKVYCPLKGLSNPVLYDENLVKQKYGLIPSQLIDYKTLMGDPSDNVPGISGIGPKTAAELLQKYGSIEGIYQNLELIKGSIKDKLKAGEKDLKLAKRLVTIILDAPITLNLEKCRLADYDWNKVVALFRELEFNTLIPRLPMDIHEFKVKMQSTKGKKPASGRLRRPTAGKDENQLGLF